MVHLLAFDQEFWFIDGLSRVAIASARNVAIHLHLLPHFGLHSRSAPRMDSLRGDPGLIDNVHVTPQVALLLPSLPERGLVRGHDL